MLLQQPAQKAGGLAEVHRVRRRVFGRSHRSTRIVATTLADALKTQGQHAEAEPLFRSVLERLAAAKTFSHACSR